VRGQELSVAFRLSQARVDYIMSNPTSFLDVRWGYSPDERCIDIRVYDTRGVFANKDGIALVKQFEKSLEAICKFVDVRRFRNAKIKAIFYAQEGDTPLGWYDRGKYYPWGWLGDESLVVSSRVDLVAKFEAIKKIDPKLGKTAKKLLIDLARREMGVKTQRKWMIWKKKND